MLTSTCAIDSWINIIFILSFSRLLNSSSLISWEKATKKKNTSGILAQESICVLCYVMESKKCHLWDFFNILNRMQLADGWHLKRGKDYLFFPKALKKLFFQSLWNRSIPKTKVPINKIIRAGYGKNRRNETSSLFACLFSKKGPFFRHLYGPQSYISASNLRVSIRVPTRKLAQLRHWLLH